MSRLLGLLTDGLAAVLALALLSACGESHAQACTLVAAASGIDVDYASLVVHHPRVRIAMQTCLGSECRIERYPNVQPRTEFVRFGPGVLKSGKPQTVRVTISDAAGQGLFQGQVEVTPRKEQVNGPGCAPTTWVGKVVATGTDTLTETIPQ